jgi:hypothetical protein
MGPKTGVGMLLCMWYSGGLVVSHVSGDHSLVTRHVKFITVRCCLLLIDKDKTYI